MLNVILVSTFCNLFISIVKKIIKLMIAESIVTVKDKSDDILN